MTAIKRVLSLITIGNIAIVLVASAALGTSVWAYANLGIKEAGFELSQAHNDLYRGIRAHCEVRRDAQPRSAEDRQIAAGQALQSADNADQWATHALDRGAWLSSDTRKAVGIVRERASLIRSLYGDDYLAGNIEEKLSERCPGVLASTL